MYISKYNYIIKSTLMRIDFFINLSIRYYIILELQMYCNILLFLLAVGVALSLLNFNKQIIN